MRQIYPNGSLLQQTNPNRSHPTRRSAQLRKKMRLFAKIDPKTKKHAIAWFGNEAFARIFSSKTVSRSFSIRLLLEQLHKRQVPGNTFFLNEIHSRNQISLGIDSFHNEINGNVEVVSRALYIPKDFTDSTSFSLLQVPVYTKTRFARFQGIQASPQLLQNQLAMFKTTFPQPRINPGWELRPKSKAVFPQPIPDPRWEVAKSKAVSRMNQGKRLGHWVVSKTTYPGAAPDAKKWLPDPEVTFVPNPETRAWMISVLDLRESNEQRQKMVKNLVSAFSRIYTNERRKFFKVPHVYHGPHKSENDKIAQAAIACIRSKITPTQLIHFWQKECVHFDLAYPPLAFIAQPQMIDQAVCKVILPKSVPGRAAKADRVRRVDEGTPADFKHGLDKRLRPMLMAAGFDLTEWNDRYLMSIQSCGRTLAHPAWGRHYFISDPMKEMAEFAAKHIFGPDLGFPLAPHVACLVTRSPGMVDFDELEGIDVSERMERDEPEEATGDEE